MMIVSRREEQQQRLQAETRTGQFSDEVANEVLAWLMTKPLTRADESMIMEIVEQKMRTAGNLALRPGETRPRRLLFAGAVPFVFPIPPPPCVVPEVHIVEVED